MNGSDAQGRSVAMKGLMLNACPQRATLGTVGTTRIHRSSKESTSDNCSRTSRPARCLLSSWLVARSRLRCRTLLCRDYVRRNEGRPMEAPCTVQAEGERARTPVTLPLCDLGAVLVLPSFSLSHDRVRQSATVAFGLPRPAADGAAGGVERPEPGKHGSRTDRCLMLAGRSLCASCGRSHIDCLRLRSNHRPLAAQPVHHLAVSQRRMPER
jgi:hypothetical protein